MTSAEADRYAARCTEALEVLARAAASYPERPLLDRDQAGRSAARQPLGQGHAR